MNINWQHFEPNSIPPVSGVYGFRKGSQRLYIGQSKNIKIRLKNTNHIPFKIAKEMVGVEFLFIETANHTKIEAICHRELNPNWNSRTSRGLGCWGCRVSFVDELELADAVNLL